MLSNDSALAAEVVSLGKMALLLLPHALAAAVLLATLVLGCLAALAPEPGRLFPATCRDA